MPSIESITEIFNKHNNIMRTAELNTAKIYYKDIQKLLEDGVIEKIKDGYYHFIDDSNFSEIHIITTLFPNAILCLNTALFHYGYSDRTPAEWHLAVDKDTSKRKMRIDYPFIKPYFWERHVLNLGVVQDTIDDFTVNIYDKDRTICDCLKYMNKMDKEIFNKAIQNYIQDQQKNIPNLMQYAKILRVQKKVKDLIGVWL